MRKIKGREERLKQLNERRVEGRCTIAQLLKAGLKPYDAQDLEQLHEAKDADQPGRVANRAKTVGARGRATADAAVDREGEHEVDWHR